MIWFLSNQLCLLKTIVDFVLKHLCQIPEQFCLLFLPLFDIKIMFAAGFLAQTRSQLKICNVCEKIYILKKFCGFFLDSAKEDATKRFYLNKFDRGLRDELNQCIEVFGDRLQCSIDSNKEIEQIRM